MIPVDEEMARGGDFAGLRALSARVDGSSVIEVTSRYGTPVWIYDADVIRAQVQKLTQFDVVRFAQKASSNIHILRLMREQGVLVDAVSDGELSRALAAGYAIDGVNDPITFTADVLDRSTLEQVVELRVPVNAGSPQMLEQLGQLSPGHPVWIRVNPGFGHGHSKKTNTGGEHSKHGIWHEHLAGSLRLVEQYGLDLIGFHMHIGSGVDYSHLERVCAAMIQVVKGAGCDVRAISAGGGLSVPQNAGDAEVDTEHYFRLWDAARNDVAAFLGHPVRLEVEPGRFLVAQSGIMVAEVRAFKEVGVNKFVLVDAGFNDLMRPVLYGSRHEVTIVAPSGQIRNTPNEEVVLAGPLCEAGDVFTQAEGGEVHAVMLPKVQVGDLAVFHDTGAYGASMSSTYNSRPLIPEVLLEGGQFRLIRRRQTIDELLALEYEV